MTQSKTVTKPNNMYSSKLVTVFLVIATLSTNEAGDPKNETTSNHRMNGTKITLLGDFDVTNNNVKNSKNDSSTAGPLPAWLIANLVFVSFGLLANLMVLSLSAFTWRISTHYKLTTCLAISDALYCIFYLLLQSNQAVSADKNFIGAVGPVCKIVSSLVVANVFADSWLIVLLSMERYVSICHPLRGGLKLKYIYSLVFAIIAFSFISIVPFLINVCEPVTSAGFFPAYSTYMLVVAAGIPCLVLAGLYTTSINTLRSLTRSLLNCTNTAVTRRRQQENKRILFIIASLVFAYFILFVPSAIMSVIVSYGVKMTPFWREFVDVYTENVLPLHCIFNPVIYSLVDQRVRKLIASCFLRDNNNNTQSEYWSLKSTTTVV